MSHSFNIVDTSVDTDEYESAMESTPVQSFSTTEGMISVTEPAPSSAIIKERWTNLLAYWLLGLTNNFAYVVMLSAAHDILSQDFSNDAVGLPENATNISNPRDCNRMSTGAILLADIIPSLIMKIFAPFMWSHVHFRVGTVVMLCGLSFVLVGEAVSENMAIIGVVCASASSGLGEVTFLAYTARFHRNVVSTWSSGTGAAGLFGALSYAGFTSAGLTPRTTVLLMLIIPVIMSLSFWLLLKHPNQAGLCGSRQNYKIITQEEDDESVEAKDFEVSLRFSEKMELLPSLLKYMIPIALVYIAEYVINQGLVELIYFPGEKDWLNHHEQYRWYQATYQLGVLISRSSVNFFYIRQIWITTVLQWLNVLIFLTSAIFWWISSIWVILVLILWEGLLGGAAYVNTFYKITEEVSDHQKPFAMAITTLSDTVGVTIAGFISIPLHNVICQLPL
ncbi:battenin-like [Penaeus indicus]|uniref:battenin-like n=1 Tax=Penaeus indicus TaxID=29960 RepID=UPI00300D9C56